MNDESKNWFVSSSELDGQEIITKGRRHLGYVMNSGEYNERVEIEWSYEPLPGGMPSEVQDKKMNEVAFRLQKELEDAKAAYLTAIYTGREKFIMIFYARSIDQFAELMYKVLDEYEQLPIEIGRIDDAHWTDYKEMLERNGMME